VTDIDVSAVKAAFETASSYSEIATIAVTIGVFIEFVALFIFGKEMPPAEKGAMIFATFLIVAGCAGEFIFGSRANTAASQLQQVSDEKIASLGNDSKRLAGDAEAAKRDTAKAVADASAAKERTAQLEIELENEQLKTMAIEERQKPRSLDAHRADLLTCLGASEKGAVYIRVGFVDTEAQLYAKQLEDLFREAGFEIKQWPIGGLGWSKLGIFMIVRDVQKAPTYAVTVQECFMKNGIDMIGYADANHPDGEVSIGVGSKP
jgi:outer membrane murein-binding lipoprotein Lpp